MADYRIPPPHTPIPPSSHIVESSAIHQKTQRLEEFELIRIKIEQFIIMASNDPKMYENVFMQIASLQELIQSGILNADQENLLIEELSKLEFELTSGNIKIKDIYERIFNFNSQLEEKYPKVKVFDVFQSLKNNLCTFPLDDLPAFDINQFKSYEKDILQFLRGDVENFRINKLYNLLKSIHENFLHHPRRFQADTIGQIDKIVEDIRTGSI